VSPLVEIRLVALRELRRNIRSAKGITVGVLTLLGALVTSLAAVWLEGLNRAQSNADSTQAYMALKEQVLAAQTGDPAFAHYVARIPTSLLIFLQITVWLSPLLVALLGFDVFSGELQHRSLRFWTVRARRSSLFLGKLLGLWALVGLIALVLNALAGAVALVRGYVSPGDLVTWGALFWFVVFVIAGAWAAIATLISACFRTPILALLTTFATFFVLWLVSLGGIAVRLRQPTEGGFAAAAAAHQQMAWYEYLYPNAYQTLLLSAEAGRVFGAVAVLLAFVALTAAAGSLLLQRSDV